MDELSPGIKLRIKQTSVCGISINVHRSVRGNYLRPWCYLSTNFFTSIIVILILVFPYTNGTIMGEQCDWKGNGLSLSSSFQNRGVTPVYLRCSQGHIRWTYPRGALRVLLRLPQADREFRGCIRVDPDFASARIFQEGRRSLTPLFAMDDGGHRDLIRCFQSIGGQAALYVEADGAVDFRKRVAGFRYDLMAMSKGQSVVDLVNDECRPCTRQELAHAYCSSDLVTRGSIESIEDHEKLEIAQIHVRVRRTLRQSLDDPVDNVVKFHMARHCDPQHGPGEFIFMGRKRLGDLGLVCVATLAEWSEIVRSKNADGSAHCVLKGQ